MAMEREREKERPSKHPLFCLPPKKKTPNCSCQKIRQPLPVDTWKVHPKMIPENKPPNLYWYCKPSQLVFGDASLWVFFYRWGLYLIQITWFEWPGFPQAGSMFGWFFVGFGAVFFTKVLRKLKDFCLSLGNLILYNTWVPCLLHF